MEEVNKLVVGGMPFRDAYKKVGLDIEAGKFTYSKQIAHVHEGSIGKLCNEEIAKEMKKVVALMPTEKVAKQLNSLINR